ncbi:MAG: hypothetical protein AAFP77_22965 [Bacteroidota bacterium]
MNYLKEINKEIVDKILSSPKQKYLLRFEEHPSTIEFWEKLNDKILSNHDKVEIYLYGNKGKWKNLDFLRYLSNLQRLNINSSDIVDINGLEFTPNLKFLRLDCLYLKDHHPIQYLRRLSDLYLGSTENNISLSFLESLDGLAKLQIWGRKKDFHVLKSGGIRFLTVEDTRIEEDIIGIFNAMHSLEILELSRVDIENLNVLKRLNEKIRITLL